MTPAGLRLKGAHITRLSVSHDATTRSGSEQRNWVQTIQLWAAARDHCLRLDRVVPYRPVRVAGVVQQLRVDPREGVVEVTVTDGAGDLVARWPIRGAASTLRAVPGRGLILEGIARIDRRGRLMMIEPACEIVSGPEPG
jgi:hypothetical protein